MRKLISRLAFAILVCPQAFAQLAPPASTPTTAPAAPKKAEPDEAGLEAHRHYRNKAGQDIHSPAKSVDGKVPAGASAKCRDGSYSFSKSRRGTCSGHGGVSAWL